MATIDLSRTGVNQWIHEFKPLLHIGTILPCISTQVSKSNNTSLTLLETSRFSLHCTYLVWSHKIWRHQFIMQSSSLYNQPGFCSKYGSKVSWNYNWRRQFSLVRSLGELNDYSIFVKRQKHLERVCGFQPWTRIVWVPGKHLQRQIVQGTFWYSAPRTSYWGGWWVKLKGQIEM